MKKPPIAIDPGIETPKTPLWTEKDGREYIPIVFGVRPGALGWLKSTSQRYDWPSLGALVRRCLGLGREVDDARRRGFTTILAVNPTTQAVVPILSADLNFSTRGDAVK